MLVCVKPHLEIPHVMTFKGVTYELKPFAEVPDELGSALVKNQPHHFFEISVEESEKVNLRDYTFKDAFKNKTIQDIVAVLSDEDKLKVYDLAKKLASPQPLVAVQDVPVPSKPGKPKAGHTAGKE